ncbi:MAG: site-specific integrase [Sphingopyxis sp.]|nr:site-specific integrase [Sphingopyxis sp.]
MARHKFTDRWIRSRKAPPQGRQEYCDLLVPGLRLRVSGRDVRAFSTVLRLHGQFRRYTIGRHPRWTLAAARGEALRIMRMVDAGLEPAVSFASAPPQSMSPPIVEVPPTPIGPTFAQMVDAYVKLHARPNARSWRNIASGLRHAALEHLQTRPAEQIAKADLVAVLDKMVLAGTPQGANSMRTRLGMVFRWAADRDMIPANPAIGLRMPARATERDRVLTGPELAAVWRATYDVGQPFGALVRMLALLGQRRSETATMRWCHVVGKEWHIPRTKQGRPHIVPLSDFALSEIQALRPATGDGFVFSTDGGKTHFSGYSKAKAQLDKLSDTDGWCLHDLRRGCRSSLSRLGVPRHICKKIIGHADGKIDRIYDVFDALDDRRAGLLRHERFVLSLTDRKNAD